MAEDARAGQKRARGDDEGLGGGDGAGPAHSSATSSSSSSTSSSSFSSSFSSASARAARRARRVWLRPGVASPHERSEAAWSALGELLIDVIPSVVCAGYWREVGSNIALCRATWRDKNTWGALKKFGRYDEDEYSRLHWACAYGKEARVLELLTEFRFDIETRDNIGRRPLILACFFGHTAVARRLLDRGAALEARSEYGATAPYSSNQEGHLNVMRLLLYRGASVSATANDSSFPLYIASQFGHVAVVRELLSRGAAVDARIGMGATSLHVASAKGHVAVAQELLSRGAAVHARTNDNTTPLIMACLNGHLEVAKLLISRGVDVNAVDNFGSAQQAAAEGKHAEVEALLLAHGAV